MFVPTEKLRRQVSHLKKWPYRNVTSMGRFLSAFLLAYSWKVGPYPLCLKCLPKFQSGLKMAYRLPQRVRILR